MSAFSYSIYTVLFSKQNLLKPQQHKPIFISVVIYDYLIMGGPVDKSEEGNRFDSIYEIKETNPLKLMTNNLGRQVEASLTRFSKSDRLSELIQLAPISIW